MQAPSKRSFPFFPPTLLQKLSSCQDLIFENLVGGLTPLPQQKGRGVAHYELVSNWEQNMLYNKSQKNFCRKKVLMLTGFKVSPLGSKCVFYRPEHNAKGRGTPWN